VFFSTCFASRGSGVRIIRLPSLVLARDVLVSRHRWFRGCWTVDEGVRTSNLTIANHRIGSFLSLSGRGPPKGSGVRAPLTLKDGRPDPSLLTSPRLVRLGAN
jgi:hypothetical protein